MNGDDFTTVLVFLLIFGLIIALYKVTKNMIISGGSPSAWDDDVEEEEAVTTISTTTQITPQYDIEGSLQAHKEGSQYYVIDPVDNQKIWLNDSDDMYEDADGKIWSLNYDC